MATEKYGFTPNLLGKMAEAPSLLEAYVTVGSLLNRSSLTETEQQIIMLTNSALNGCSYCMAAHSTLSQMAKIPAHIIDSLRNSMPIADEKLEALRLFTRIVHQTRGLPTQEETNAFLDAGYTQQNILEVILGTAFKVMSNYTNHFAHTDVDAAFAENAWAK